MNEEKLMTESAVLDGSKLWDEIFKAMIGTMPEQIFPVIKEAYERRSGKTSKFLYPLYHPEDTPKIRKEEKSYDRGRVDRVFT